MVFQHQLVRPSTRDQPRFSLAMGRSLGFGSTACNYADRSPRAHFRLGFPTAPGLNPLTSLHTVTRRFIMQKARGHAFPMSPDRSPAVSGIALPLFVGTRFQVLFHSPPGVLFTFPSRYWFTIGHQEYLALEGGPPEFPQGFSCPVVLGNIPGVHTFSHTGLLPSMAVLSSTLSAKVWICNSVGGLRSSVVVPRPPLE